MRLDCFSNRLFGRCLAFVALLFFAQSLSAQRPPQGQGGGAPQGPPPTGTIKGVVFDSLTAEGIPFASVAVISARDSTVVAGVMTDENGRFTVEIPRPGGFRVSIQFIGYEDRNLGPFRLTPKDGMDLDLGRIPLRSSAELLKDVVVEAEEKVLINHIDRKVFLADKLAVATGGTSVDLLSAVPSVDVDADGGITLRGTGNVNILIDGKPSSITGGSRQAILEQIPASSVERIEIITNPSAKYDPDGVSGIINIVLKKNRQQGLNGSVSAGLGTREKYNGSLQLGYRQGAWNFFVNANTRWENFFSKNNSYRENYLLDGGLLNIFSQNSDNTSLNRSNLFKAGMEFSPNKKTTFALNGTAGLTNRNGDELLNTFFFDNGGRPTVFSTRDGLSGSLNQNYEVNGYFRREFDQSMHYLTLDVTHGYSPSQSDRHFSQYGYTGDLVPTGIFNWQNTTDKQSFNLTTLQADYAKPFGQVANLETGLKTIIRQIDQDFYSESFNAPSSVFLPDVRLNNRFVYDETILSGYANYGRSFGKFGVQVGLRLEQALTESNLITTSERFVNNYFSYFPSVFLKFEPTEDQVLQLGYSRRINRPGMEQLNPFTDYSDTLNLFRGNPFALPEYINSLDLSWSSSWKKFTFQPSLYFRVTEDMLTRYVTIDTATRVNTVTFLNLNRSRTVGLDMAITGNPFPWWSFTWSASNFYETIDAGNVAVGLSSARYTWSTKLNTSFNYKRIVDLQLSGSYRSPMVRPQGQMLAMYFMDVALTWRFWKGMGSLTLRVSDVFDTREFNIEVQDPLFSRDMFRKRESRIGYLTFQYRFGKNDQKRNNRRKEEQPGGGERMEF